MGVYFYLILTRTSSQLLLYSRRDQLLTAGKILIQFGRPNYCTPMIRFLRVIVFDHNRLLKIFSYQHKNSIRLIHGWKLLHSYHSSLKGFHFLRECTFAVSVAFIFVQPFVKLRIIPTKLPPLLSLDCGTNNSQIHKFISVLSYTSKRPVSNAELLVTIMHAYYMKIDFVWFEKKLDY